MPAAAVAARGRSHHVQHGRGDVERLVDASGVAQRGSRRRDGVANRPDPPQ